MKKLISLESLLLLFILSFARGSYHYMDKNLEIHEIDEEDFRLGFAGEGAVLIGSFQNFLNLTGWSMLTIETNKSYSDYEQMYAAGYYEGFQTYQLIWDAWNNFVELLLNNKSVLPGDAQQFVTNQTNWILKTAQDNIKDNFWQLINATMSQLFGMYDGYLAAIQKNGLSKEYHLTFDEFYFLTNMGDLEDIIPAYSSDFPYRYFGQYGECTGFVRLVKNDLIATHSTFNIYPLMLRVFKDLKINLNNPLVKASHIVFSARPGDMESKDDYYFTDTNLVVMETSLNNYNTTNYDYFHYDSLPCWLRCLVATRIATNASQWAKYFFDYHSGTHNNQWVIVDYNQYANQKSNIEKAHDIVWIIEEFYSLTSAQDVTQALLIPQGYVGSYNVPYNQSIWDISGYNKSYPFNYTSDPRALLMKKYGPNVNDVQGAMKLIRYNNQSDTGDICSAIAPRCDLLPKEEAYPFGAIDGKVTSSLLMKAMASWIISGPTTQNLPPFSWSNWTSYPHRGMPNTFNFEWLLYKSPLIKSFEEISI